MIKLVFKTLLFVLFLTNSQQLVADLEGSVEFRSAAFFPTSKRFREIYGNATASYQVEASTRVYDCFDGWANFDWMTRHGRSDGFNQSTRINIANFSFGAKYLFENWNQFFPCINLCQLTPYVGIGPSFSKVWLKNNACCSRRHLSKWAYGVVVKTGINYYVCKNVFLDVFVDYLYQPVHFHTHVDIGGFKTGAGIGVSF